MVSLSSLVKEIRKADLKAKSFDYHSSSGRRWRNKRNNAYARYMLAGGKRTEYQILKVKSHVDKLKRQAKKKK